MLNIVWKSYTIILTMLFLPLFCLGGIIVLSVNELLDIAKSELINLKCGEIFLVRDLFKGYEWNRISRSDRLLLGTLFLNYIKNENIGVIPIEKTSSGQQRYKYITEEIIMSKSEQSNKLSKTESKED